MNCPTCDNPANKFGEDRNGRQRFRCAGCEKTFQETQIKILGDMTLAHEKALPVLAHLIEGCSIRSTERLNGVHRDTIMRLLVLAGTKCEALMLDRIQGLSVKDVECDEIWGFVGMKQKTKHRLGKGEDETLGDAWTFTAIERHSRLILAWHLGHRTSRDTLAFTEKLAHATDGKFQISTDGFAAYRDAVVESLGMQKVDFAQIIKIYQNTQKTAETRYSPAQCIGCEKVSVFGRPDMAQARTSRVERSNLTLRMENRRFTRLTNAFSKKWASHHAMLALSFAHYNFCRIHRTIRCTPTMEAGVTKTVWSLKTLLKAATQF